MRCGYDDSMAARMRAELSTFTALGGTHTCGYADLRQNELFRTVAFRALRMQGAVRKIQNSCIMGTGPMYPSCCMPYFVPANTKYATLEFVSSMHDNKELHLEHLHHMMQRLLAQRIRLVVVNIIPSDPDGSLTRTATDVATIAWELGVRVLTFDHKTNETLWNTPSRLNVAGHSMIGQSAAATLLLPRQIGRKSLRRNAAAYIKAEAACSASRARDLLPKIARTLPNCNGSSTLI